MSATDGAPGADERVLTSPSFSEFHSFVSWAGRDTSIISSGDNAVSMSDCSSDYRGTPPPSRRFLSDSSVLGNLNISQSSPSTPQRVGNKFDASTLSLNGDTPAQPTHDPSALSARLTSLLQSAEGVELLKVLLLARHLFNPRRRSAWQLEFHMP
jgi:hypothetical protein